MYIVEPTKKQLTAVSAVSFDEIGIRERQDLEAWVESNSELLGEELLILTCEFDQFDKSKRRLDALALDKSGSLVVVELKLELSGSHADQQAIRYAAFCSTMTMEDALDALATYEGCSKKEAEAKVLQFLEVEALPELNDRPRIILAAGSLDDQELTSTVLWLRSFGLDISCIELTPYRMPAGGPIVLVPKTIIPLPEAKEYIVKVQQKDVARIAKSKGDASVDSLWKAIAKEFNGLGLERHTEPPQNRTYMPVRPRNAQIHYEWALLKREKLLRVALHFESDNKTVNLSRLSKIAALSARLQKESGAECFAEPWGRKWASAEFRLAYDERTPVSQLAPEAVRLMRILIEVTAPIVKDVFDPEGDDGTKS